MRLIAELRHRHVFQVAAWYSAAAWGLIEIASTIVPEFELPAWTVRAVIVAAVAGFPVAALLAWAFDLTRSGIKPGTPAPEEPATTSPARGVLSLVIAVAAGALLGIGAVTGWQTLEAPPTRPGIAVLTFDLLGQEDNRTLAGGLHEAVLEELSHISGLRVIARTSVLRFAAEHPDIRDVGRILDVPYVLEGSVQREGRQLRVHAQLIDASTNEHLWSQSYDREVSNIFSVQTALAQDIAERLRVALLPAEAERAKTPPTVVPAAYQLYLNGLNEFSRYEMSGGENARMSLLVALESIDRSLALDPAFALAHAERARTLLTMWWVFHASEPETTAAPEQALLSVTEALRLEPDLGEAHRALGLYYYWALLDYPSAERELALARSLLPNDSVSAYILALVRRRQNRFDEAIDLLHEAYRLNPADALARDSYLFTLIMHGRYVRADTELSDMISRFPEDLDQNFTRAWLSFCHTGDTQGYRIAADNGLSNPGIEAYARWLASRYEGRFDEALQIVRAAPESGFGLEFQPLVLARSYYEAGDFARAATAARVVIERFESGESALPSEMLAVHKGLADAYLFAGQPEHARRAARAYLDETPLERVAIDFYQARYWTAKTYAALGDTERALELLNITQPGPFHPCGNELRREPVFATLRNNRPFQQLAAESDWK